MIKSDPLTKIKVDLKLQRNSTFFHDHQYLNSVPRFKKSPQALVNQMMLMASPNHNDYNIIDACRLSFVHYIGGLGV